MNDFILKSCVNLLKSYECKNFEHVKFIHSEEKYFVYVFRFEYDGYNFYHIYHDDKSGPIDIDRYIIEHIKDILNSYNNPKEFRIDTYFILNQCMFRLSFEEKINFSLDSDKLHAFNNKHHNKYYEYKDFLEIFDDIDLVAEFGAYDN